jgi:uncharacterized iron-regulated membrane protein
MIRHFFVWLHRWTGFLLAGFLIIEGLTGSLLAFNTELTRLFNPTLFATPPSLDAPRLDLATLAARAARLLRHRHARPGRDLVQPTRRPRDRQAL